MRWWWWWYDDMRWWQWLGSSELILWLEVQAYWTWIKIASYRYRRTPTTCSYHAYIAVPGTRHMLLHTYTGTYTYIYGILYQARWIWSTPRRHFQHRAQRGAKICLFIICCWPKPINISNNAFRWQSLCISTRHVLMVYFKIYIP